MKVESESPIKLTAYSHGAGCGCKISPQVLNEMLEQVDEQLIDRQLLVGNDTRDDAAVYRLDEETAIISTTDFFMPIVDDPFDFGGIASVNAISDVYAMGGTPLMAIAILGWPVDKLPASVAREVLAGARDACKRAGIVIAGGHSIDAPEPIFGLAVTGKVNLTHIRTNAEATPDCELYLTKPLGVGILTTAQKRGILRQTDFVYARASMLQLNQIGELLGKIAGVKSMTDVTGFGLLGHLIEMCEASKLYAEIEYEKVPRLDGLGYYMEQKSFPGGTQRNFTSYGEKVSTLSEAQKGLLCDPQTSGGLLVAVDSRDKEEFLETLLRHQIQPQSFGVLKDKGSYRVEVK